MQKCKVLFYLGVFFVITTIFSIGGCENLEKKQNYAQSNSEKLIRIISEHLDSYNYLVNNILYQQPFELIIEINSDIIEDSTIINKYIEFIKRIADSCQPLFYYRKTNHGKELMELNVSLIVTHKQDTINIAQLSFLENKLIENKYFSDAIAKYKFIKSKEVWAYLQKRWDFYEKRDGDYLQKHDNIVLGEAAKKYKITYDEVFQMFSIVEFEQLGFKPKESLPLKNQNTTVNISIQDVFINENFNLCITIKNNNTAWTKRLPTINLTCDLDRVIWAVDLGRNETKTFCSLWQTGENYTGGDYVEIIAYMNIDEMKKNNLKSFVQTANDIGETVIPILKKNKYKINYYGDKQNIDTYRHNCNRLSHMKQDKLTKRDKEAMSKAKLSHEQKRGANNKLQSSITNDAKMRKKYAKYLNTNMGNEATITVRGPDNTTLHYLTNIMDKNFAAMIYKSSENELKQRGFRYLECSDGMGYESAWKIF